ncbi:MAG: hypothetical protein ACLP7A_10745, partial [Desulfobaccales bacterium]
VFASLPRNVSCQSSVINLWISLAFSPLPQRGRGGLGIFETPPSALDKGLLSYFQYYFASHYAKSQPDTTA